MVDSVTTPKKGFSMGFETYPNVAPAMPSNQMFWRKGRLLRIPFTDLEFWLVKVWPR